MGRPRLPVGTFGKITHSTVTGPNPCKARAKFRGRDGKVVYIARFSTTKAKAERALKIALAAAQTATTRVSAATTTADLAAAWLEGIEESDRAIGTKSHYRYVVGRYVLPHLGDLRAGEVDTWACDMALRKIVKTNGPSAAKSTRAVLNGVFGLAVRHNAVTVNPVRETESIRGRRSSPRALTREQEDQLGDKLRAHPLAVRWDLPDLVDWMLGTGCRIGEAMAARDALNVEGAKLLDLDAGTWEVNATVIRIKGQGLVVQEHPKSDSSHRVLQLPGFVLDLAGRRAKEERLRPATVAVMGVEGAVRRIDGFGVVFPAPAAPALRDGSNTQSDLRVVLDSLDCERCGFTGWQLDPDGAPVLNAKGHRVRCRLGPWSWVSSHTLRKTVATKLFQAMQDGGAVADQMGHAQQSMTLDVYGGRRVANPAAARILDR